MAEADPDGGDALLPYGLRAAKKRADRDHPAAYGRERYLWRFIAAPPVFAPAAGVLVPVRQSADATRAPRTPVANRASIPEESLTPT